jgi:hypothetical protein
MGLFLAAAGIAGVAQAEVVASLGRYSAANANDMRPDPGASTEDSDVLVVYEGSPARVSVFYPKDVMDWDDISRHLSEDLKAPVFSFHIHDEDLWMYLFFVLGEERDKFNPIPKYWDDNEPAEPWGLPEADRRAVAERRCFGPRPVSRAMGPRRRRQLRSQSPSGRRVRLPRVAVTGFHEEARPHVACR